MSKIVEKASRARRLRGDDAFCEFMEEVRDWAIAQFTESGAADTAIREEAHAILRALAAIEGRLQSAIDAESFEKKKGQHRGND
jgi:hypothetical protein